MTSRAGARARTGAAALRHEVHRVLDLQVARAPRGLRVALELARRRLPARLVDEDGEGGPARGLALPRASGVLAVHLLGAHALEADPALDRLAAGALARVPHGGAAREAAVLQQRGVREEVLSALAGRR